jgi:hypothetical protein
MLWNDVMGHWDVMECLGKMMIWTITDPFTIYKKLLWGHNGGHFYGWFKPILNCWMIEVKIESKQDLLPQKKSNGVISCNNNTPNYVNTPNDVTQASMICEHCDQHTQNQIKR